MEGDFEKRLKVHGVSHATCAILNAVKNDDKTTPASLTSFIAIDAASITRHLDRLEGQELLLRERSTTDRRVESSS